MNNIESKLDRLDSRMDNLEVISAQQHLILQDHVRRSLANEEAIDILRNEVKDRHKELVDRLQPFEKVADRIMFLLQVAVWIGGAMGIIGSAISLYTTLKH